MTPSNDNIDVSKDAQTPIETLQQPNHVNKEVGLGESPSESVTAEAQNEDQETMELTTKVEDEESPSTSNVNEEEKVQATTIEETKGIQSQTISRI